ncbi:MAG TPA: beta-ketoacyl-ACP synthase II [Candidatus Hydrothermia bacterium]|nr:beta-ketoacyl-ACP synthase II [Candidatus Hydrothermae bacterium]MDD3649197.1 beta-ketoacyl-ACP synthase II [Candidatus Hydrothermia bacterium]MDD5572401.1 beta-ketoacyl-ACP synthase II [Candidatus Hydrothermia bacterium]HOK22612.1 beta-ketoacyl-ACP synthase II [Candidatus Hydrothermia bacterium]HOL23321.1 beta-ketoacyl-ACP synthase II [Candidatus Hydrothermia bacterium]
MKRRVVVTGLGVITPVGKSVAELWNALLSKSNGITKIERFDVSQYSTQIAGVILDFNPETRLDPKDIKRMDPVAHFAMYAAHEAISDAGLTEGNFDPYRTGVIISSGIGGLQTLEGEVLKLYQSGPKKVSPFLIPMLIVDMLPGHVSMKYGFKGPNYSVVSACASSSHAIGDAYRVIQYGDADIMVAGGAEASITPVGLAAFCNMRALSTRNNEPERASRPFDKERDGFVMGEGAGVVVLEELEHALNRGARIYAEIVGYGATADAYHITAPHPEGEGAVNAMKRAIEEADIRVEEVSYINAHGTSTQLNDVSETKAIKKVFGDYAYKVPISSTKSMTGHLLGAAGAVEFVATVMSIFSNKIHPTRNYEFPDPECDLDYVPEGPRELEVNYALSNSFGFGGHNAAILVKKYSS